MVTGYSPASSLPAVSGVPLLGNANVARLSEDGKSIEDLYIGPDFSTGLALVLTSTANFVTLGQNGSLWIQTAATGPSLLGTANAAGGGISGQVAPSQLISLYGLGIGPRAAIDGQVQNGAFTSVLGGYQVLFDGIAAPLLYVGPTQINTAGPSMDPPCNSVRPCRQSSRIVQPALRPHLTRMVVSTPGRTRRDRVRW